MRKFIKIIIGTIIVISFSGCSSEEDLSYNPEYYGTVINSQTNTPYSGITVAVTNGYETRLTTHTDASGNFRFSINVKDLTGDFYILIGDDKTEKKKFDIIGVSKPEIDLGTIMIYPLAIPKIVSFNFKEDQEQLLFMGEIELDDNWELKEIGVCYGKNNEPTIDDTRIIAKTDGSSFYVSININDLDLSSTYYFRAYAINSVGTGYSNATKYETTYATPELKWLTDAFGNSYTDLTPESIILYAIASSSTYKIIEAGVCYSTFPQPTLKDNVVKSGYTDFWSQNYSVNIYDLTPDTKYYVRPYAINSKGVEGYGPEFKFQTLSGLATLKITYWGYDYGGYQAHVLIESSGGGEIKKAGVCYSGDPNPTVSNDIVLGSPDFDGTFSTYIPITSYDTVVYIRAFAETQYGISYSQQESIYIPG